MQSSKKKKKKEFQIASVPETRGPWFEILLTLAVYFHFKSDTTRFQFLLVLIGHFPASPSFLEAPESCCRVPVSLPSSCAFPKMGRRDTKELFRRKSRRVEPWPQITPTTLPPGTKHTYPEQSLLLPRRISRPARRLYCRAGIHRCARFFLLRPRDAGQNYVVNAFSFSFLIFFKLFFGGLEGSSRVFSNLGKILPR